MAPQKDIPQWQMVLIHLMVEPGLTQRQAERRYGVGRLASRIRDLVEMGFDVVNEPTKVKKSNGKKVTIAKYYLAPNPEIV